jgi:manganese transport protein
LTKNRVPVRDSLERARVLRYERLDIVIALGAAGLVNVAMLAVAAKLFLGTHVSTIQQAYHGFGNQVGGVAALAFVVALLASGASSSSVGTYAGQVVMQGFVGLNVRLVVRRAVTMIPALVVLAIGVNPTAALIASQVVLSFGIPFALIPLVMLTRRVDLMGDHVNRLATSVIGAGLAGAITLMNGFLIYQQLAG